jgi:hypothetical protein
LVISSVWISQNNHSDREASNEGARRSGLSIGDCASIPAGTEALRQVFRVSKRADLADVASFSRPTTSPIERCTSP